MDKLGPSNGHSLVDRRNLAKGGAADDRTGVSLGVKKKATVLDMSKRAPMLEKSPIPLGLGLR